MGGDRTHAERRDNHSMCCLTHARKNSSLVWGMASPDAATGETEQDGASLDRLRSEAGEYSDSVPRGKLSVTRK